MINSIIDNLNNLQNVKSAAQSGENTYVSFLDNKHSDSFKKDGFEKVYEQNLNNDTKSTSKSAVETIGSLRESHQKIGSEVSKELEAFKDFLEKTFEESNAESSLDLTLARDIDEIISELKDAVSDETSEVLETEAEEDTEQDTEQETDSLVYAGINPDIIAKFRETLSNGEEYANTDSNSDLEVSLLDTAEELTNELESNKLDSNSMSADIELVDVESDTTVSDTSKTQTSENDLESLLDEDALKELNIESIEADTDTSSDDGGSLMDNQSPQEQAVKAMLHSDGETFDLNAVKSNQNIQSAQSVQPKTADISPSKIIEQITKQMEGLFNNSKVNIVLNPESLGRVNIQLVNSPEGLSAQFTVANHEVRDILMKGLDGLKDTLASHGVGVDNVSVKVSDTQKEADTPDWTEQEGSRGGNKGQNQPDREEKEKGLFEQTIAQTINNETNNADV